MFSNLFKLIKLLFFIFNSIFNFTSDKFEQLIYVRRVCYWRLDKVQPVQFSLVHAFLSRDNSLADEVDLVATQHDHAVRRRSKSDALKSFVNIRRDVGLPRRKSLRLLLSVCSTTNYFYFKRFLTEFLVINKLNAEFINGNIVSLRRTLILILNLYIISSSNIFKFQMTSDNKN